jgi:type II secretory pathway component PulM
MVCLPAEIEEIWQNLRRLNDRIEAALRDARSLYAAAAKSTNSTALKNLKKN